MHQWSSRLPNTRFETPSANVADRDPGREDAMKVAELMQSDVKAITGDASVADAIVSLADAHVLV